jgi:polyribonucleotide 5'-hydroxyl-kinase
VPGAAGGSGEGAGAGAPLAYFFGHVTPGADGAGAEMLHNALARLGDTVGRRLAASELARTSGLLVNTMGYVDGPGYDMLVDTLKLLQCDVVAVLGNDRLYARLTEAMAGVRLPAAGGAATATAGEPPARTVTVIKLPRSGGVVERSREARVRARDARIHEYFYGPPPRDGGVPLLAPVSLTVPWDDVTIVRVGGMTSDSGILPIGRASVLDPLRTTVVFPSEATLLRKLLAVSYATAEKQVPHVNVAGFVHVCVAAVTLQPPPPLPPHLCAALSASTASPPRPLAYRAQHRRRR